MTTPDAAPPAFARGPAEPLVSEARGGPRGRLAAGAPVVGIVLFAGALLVLRHELHQLGYHQVTAAIEALPNRRVALAWLLAIANYVVLTGYDQLAFVYIGRRIPRVRIMAASFIAYAVSNTVGLAILSGGSVRYRFYSRWGLGPAELSRVVLFYSSTFWLGLLALGGLSLAIAPLPGLTQPALRETARVAGAVMLLVLVGYLAAALLRLRPLVIGKFHLHLPAPGLAAAQVAVSCLDWTLAAAVLHVLLPHPPPFIAFLSAFLAAQVLGLVSNVPGGLGVFESALVILLKPYLAPMDLVPALLLFRVIYYLGPFATALLVLVGDEIYLRRAKVARVGAIFGRLTAEITPRFFAAFTFFSGLVLLFSGATPAAPGRLHLLARFLPLGILEASHFVSSIAGVALLVVSHGVARRLDLAYHLSALGLAVGIAASLLKGADYEEATLLTLVLIALWRSREHFDRRTAFFSASFSPGWVAALAGALAASLWLGLFAFKHVEFQSDLWWQFELHSEAARSLRAGVGAAMATLVFAALRMMRPAGVPAPEPTDEELDRAAGILQAQSETYPYLVFLRDKSLLFDETGSGFLMYATQGASWVAMGDPVGPPSAGPSLVRAFLERCDDYGGRPVFYQVAKERLHLYADFGLTFAKLGEEARVPLADFALEGHKRKPLRLVVRRMEKEGCTFRVAPRVEVVARMAELRQVSDEWRAAKEAAEKGFSLGFFDEPYVARFPCALVEREGRIEAFANLWEGPGHGELSVDLMRARETAPAGAMDGLFAHLMLYGRDQGFRWFNLGMAPLSGLGSSPIATFWTRLGRFVYRHGEAFYNFQGLRSYKEKFHPVWEPRYLAYPGGLALPVILADVSALVAGGYRRIVLR